MSGQVQEGGRWTTIQERTNQTLEEGGADVTESDAQQGKPTKLYYILEHL